MPLSQTFRRLNIINLTFWPLTFHHAERALLPRSNDGPLGRWVRGLVASGLAAGALASGGRAAVPPDLAQARSVAVEHIRPDHLLSNIKTLASDEFAGRAPASVGEERTVGFLVEQFKALGLEPGNPDGSFLENVPLMGVTGEPTVTIRAGGKPLDLVIPRDCIASSVRFVPEVTLENSEMVFVGYGVVAPEYGWDDYKGVDVRGKTIVMLVGDPPVPDPADPSRLDEKVFHGRAMTYYGRWTYKYEIAAAKGAAAALIVHETGPAGYPYLVLVASHTQEAFELQSASRNLDRVAVQGWLTAPKASELFAACGKRFETLKQTAVRRDFKPVPLEATASFRIHNQLRPVASRNVIAKLEGTDPALRHEYVVYSAHWDHLGRNEKLVGDQVFNGALDNASGTAGLLELAAAFTKLTPAPKRTVLFLSVTAEEKGLLGAKHYAEHPLYPLERTLANINMDGINPWGRTRDVEVIGYGQSTLEDLLEEAARASGRTVTADSGPEKGRFYRSDHFEFAKQGVPGLYLKGGIDLVGQPAGSGQQKIDEYTQRDYHKVTDEVKPDWDMSGGAEDLRLLFEVGWRVAQAKNYPTWKTGSEFKARRDAMLQPSRPP